MLCCGPSEFLWGSDINDTDQKLSLQFDGSDDDAVNFHQICTVAMIRFSSGIMCSPGSDCIEELEPFNSWKLKGMQQDRTDLYHLQGPQLPAG